ncbi:hypothetical protein [Haloglomus irregulare]|uniref:hypothetical protein n=1 Tax=Haloglomus irregulare TaxID=2234134 RepID=UPI001EE1550A|nr:hypothetical protein [Haloglomus irregulare]
MADETPSPEDIDITAVDFDEMTFAVERALCEQHDISVHQSVDDRREELGEARPGNCCWKAYRGSSTTFIEKPRVRQI